MQTDRNLVVVPSQLRDDDKQQEPERFVDSQPQRSFFPLAKSGFCYWRGRVKFRHTLWVRDNSGASGGSGFRSLPKQWKNERSTRREEALLRRAGSTGRAPIDHRSSYVRA
jgi:hypothetical protein